MSKAALGKRDWLLLSGSAVATAAAGACHGRSNEVLAFLLAATALAQLAMVVGEATDQLGSRMGPGATGVLQSALGNLPELFVCIFSLKAGLVDVVKGALVGSILANSVLVLGLALLFGGLRNGVQKFAGEAPRMMALLMLIATAAMVMPSLAHELHTPASQHEAPFSAAVCIVLLAIFACSLPFFLKGDKTVTTPPPAGHRESWPLGISLGVLALSGIGAAFVSEWFVDALVPATTAMGISEAFSGLVVVAIAGNAIENVVGIQLAIKNKADYAISVIVNSSLQIALVLVPVLVFASFFVGPAAMTLTFPPLLVAALLLSAVITAFIVFDGESIWLEGAALVGLYAILVSAFWWG